MNAVADELRVLFLTDVEGSTRHWQRDPEHMPGALDILDRAVDDAVLPFGGEVVRSRGEGDSHFVVFPTASAAVRSAAVLQPCLSEAAWPGSPLDVRIAIHAGEVQRRYHDWAGIAIAHTARLRAAAHGGQVVASRAIVELVGKGFDELRLESLGRHRIRDLAGWTEVFQLYGPRLRTTFPPLVTLDTGLPPIATIVFLDTVGSSGVIKRLGRTETRRLLGLLIELLASSFSASDGQYLKLQGDGCFALFADPEAAVAFVRSASADARTLGLRLRSVVHVGRVEFVRDEPVGRAIFAAAELEKRAPPDQIAVSRAAAALIDDADDLVILD
jgi:class 3 adenylate cyclase